MVFFYSYVCLVCGFNHLEKYESVGMMAFPYIMEKSSKCSKPPTSYANLLDIYQTQKVRVRLQRQMSTKPGLEGGALIYA